MSAPEQVTLDEADGITVVSFGDSPVSISEDVVQTIYDRVLETTRRNPPRVLLDLQQVDFFGSSFIELLFRVWNRIRSKPNGQFALCNLHPYCREVLDVTNLTTVWKVYDSKDDAIADLNAQQAASQPSG